MTFEQWWDTVAKTPAPDTFKNWEESCRQAWAAGATAERQVCVSVCNNVADDIIAALKREGRTDDDYMKSAVAAARVCAKELEDGHAV